MDYTMKIICKYQMEKQSNCSGHKISSLFWYSSFPVSDSQHPIKLKTECTKWKEKVACVRKVLHNQNSKSQENLTTWSQAPYLFWLKISSLQVYEVAFQTIYVLTRFYSDFCGEKMYNNIFKKSNTKYFSTLCFV